MQDSRTVTVVVATGTMNAGGTESLIMEMLRHASGRVRYVMLIHHDGTPAEGVFDAEIRALGVEMHYIPAVGSVGVKAYVRAFRDFVRELGRPVDIVHSHLNGVGGAIALAASKAGIRHRICHCHADIHYTGSRLARLLSEAKLALMKGLIELYATERWACSEAAWRRLFMPWRKRVVVQNMIDTRLYLATADRREAIKAKYGLAGKKTVGAVGRVAPIKNYETILRAIAGTDVHFVCFGRFDAANAYCRSLIALAEELGVADRVHWMGNSNAVADDIHCIDVFVMPSYTEGFGMAAIEAQAAGLPCILSTGVPAAVDTGLGLVQFVAPSDADAWHTAIVAAEPWRPLSSETILKRFQDKGFDSPCAVTLIEDRYLAL